MKYALLIGINYTGTQSQLNGCVNDIKNMNTVLINKLNYPSKNITIVSDGYGNILPTRVNIIAYMKKLVMAAKKNKSINEIFIHYSGHGSYIKDKNKDEKDGYDEVLVPIDYTFNGFVTDDIIHSILSEVPLWCRCIFLSDSCHSGTIADLKYRYVGTNKNIIENKKSTIKSDIITLSGCLDKQVSMELYGGGKTTGAMTTSFLNILAQRNYSINCSTLLTDLHKAMKNIGYDQLPQMCCSRPLSASSLFYAPSKTITKVKPVIKKNNPIKIKKKTKLAIIKKRKTKAIKPSPGMAIVKERK